MSDLAREISLGMEARLDDAWERYGDSGEDDEWEYDRMEEAETLWELQNSIE